MAGKIPVEDKDTNKLLSDYKRDPRTACKYGSECYQKNPSHNKQYKHPPKTPKRQVEGAMFSIFKKKKVDSPPMKTAAELEKDGKDKNNVVLDHRSKREAISDSDSDTSPSKVDNARNDKRRDFVPDSDPDSPPSRNSDQHQTSKENISTREQISDSESNLSSTECNTKLQTEKPSSNKKRLQSERISPVLITFHAAKELIKQMFLVEMPDDFYNFWSFCQSLSSGNPEGAFKDIGLHMVGPYDVLAGNLKTYDPEKRNLYLTHWRYYYDPPEFQTCIKGDDRSQFHIGYYRDDPYSLPSFVASNCAAKGGIITRMAENIFGAVNAFFETGLKTSNPFQKIKYLRLQKALQSWADANKYTLETVTPSMKSRERNVVAKTFHRAGIVVPVEKKTELGYRELIETDARLKKIITLIIESKSDEERNIYLEKLQPIITAANIANDECDFGTSLELGIDLFSMGGEVLHGSVHQLLTTAYTLLKRPQFKEIIEAHLQNRRKGASLSMIEASN